MLSKADERFSRTTDPHTASETVLLEQVSLGNDAAFRELFHRYADVLNTFIYQLTRSQELAEEVVQDIFLQIWTSRETLSGIRNFRNYLFVISRNNALNALRKIMREKAREKEWGKTQDAQQHAGPASVSEPGLSLIEEAILQLPPQQQKAWILSRRSGKKYHEIAREMNLSRETVKKYIQYATASIMTYVHSHLELLLIGLFFTP